MSGTVLRHPAIDEVHLWTAALECPPDEVDRLTLDLPDFERERAAQFLLPAPRQQFVMSRTIVRAILGDYLDTPPVQICFEYGAQGKPILASPFSSLQFNLSHSSGMLAVAVANHRSVGVDLERVRLVPQIDALAQTYFTETERRELEISGSNILEAFFRLWTCKEALVKASGAGVSGAWADVEVVTSGQGVARVVRFGSSDGPWSLHVITAVPGFIATIAAPGVRLIVSHRERIQGGS